MFGGQVSLMALKLFTSCVTSTGSPTPAWPSVFISSLIEWNHKASQHSEGFKKTVDADVASNLVGAQRILSSPFLPEPPSVGTPLIGSAQEDTLYEVTSSMLLRRTNSLQKEESWKPSCRKKAPSRICLRDPWMNSSRCLPGAIKT